MEALPRNIRLETARVAELGSVAFTVGQDPLERIEISNKRGSLLLVERAF